MSFTREDLDVLLIHLVRSPETIQVALGANLSPEDFDPSTEQVHALLWSVSKSHWSTYSKTIAKPFVFPEIVKLIKDTEMDESSFRDSCQATIADVWSIEEKDLLPALANKLIDEFIFSRKVSSEFLNAIERTGHLDQKLWDAYQEKRSKFRVGTGNVIMPFAQDAVPMLGQTPRDPTGVMFLDHMMGGGVRCGELYGFLAPSSGGKTTFSTQLLYEFCRRNHRAVLLSYEEKVTPEYLAKLYATAVGVSLNRLEKITSINDFTDDERKRYDRVASEVRDNLAILDMSGSDGTGSGSGGVDEIDAMLTKYESMGKKFEAVIIDWFWPMLSRRFQLEENKRITDERKYVQLLTDKLKQMALRHNCWIWVNQQLSPAKSAAKKVEWYDSAEAKSFAWYMNGCFVLTGLSKDGIGTFRYSKARSGAKTEVIIRLRGEFARFEWVNDEVEYDERRKEYVVKKDRNKVMEDPHQLSMLKADASNLGLDAEVSV